jgi:4,5-dihydroxyphthalate decarboxylase
MIFRIVSPVHLKTVTRTQGNNAALKDGTVSAPGVVLDFEEVPVLIQAFRRMARELEFDVCELPFTTYLCANAYGKRFTALPVFLVRGFHHGAIVVSAKAGIREPKDLEGRMVGVNRGYTVTTGLWARGVLAQEYGVDLERVTWVLSGDEHVAEYRPPDNVISLEPGSDLAAMLAAGELAAAIGIEPDPPVIIPLIPDAAQASFVALRQRGHYPINHLVVVKDGLLEAHPELAPQLFSAFAEAKNLYVERLRVDAIANPSATDRTYQRVLEITGADPLPYGIEPNRAVIEELIHHALSQKILDRRPALDSLFAPGTLDLIA